MVDGLLGKNYEPPAAIPRWASLHVRRD